MDTTKAHQSRTTCMWGFRRLIWASRKSLPLTRTRFGSIRNLFSGVNSIRGIKWLKEMVISSSLFILFWSLNTFVQVLSRLIEATASFVFAVLLTSLQWLLCFSSSPQVTDVNGGRNKSLIEAKASASEVESLRVSVKSEWGTISDGHLQKRKS